MSTVKSIDQNSLLENCLLQKEWAQKELYEMYQAELFPICNRYATDYNEAKDILQEGFIRIFTNLKQYRNEGSLIGWMKRVIVTTALNYIKKNKKTLTKEIEPYENTINNSNNEIETNLNAKEIMNAFMQLPYAYRSILGLHIIEGYSYRELSKMLNIEESSCRTKVFRGKTMLQNILTQLENPISIKNGH